MASGSCCSSHGTLSRYIQAHCAETYHAPFCLQSPTLEFLALTNGNQRTCHPESPSFTLEQSRIFPVGRKDLKAPPNASLTRNCPCLQRTERYSIRCVLSCSATRRECILTRSFVAHLAPPWVLPCTGSTSRIQGWRSAVLRSLGSPHKRKLWMPSGPAFTMSLICTFWRRPPLLPSCLVSYIPLFQNLE